MKSINAEKVKVGVKSIAAKLEIPDVLTLEVCEAVDAILPAGATLPGRMPLMLAMLFVMLETEPEEGEGHKTYLHFRNIEHKTVRDTLKHSVEGYGGCLGGEPQFYGALNALLVFLFERYSQHTMNTTLEGLEA